jgi:hypothetical protein
MHKDKRYDIVYHNLCIGNIKKFEDIFNFIPLQVVAIDMGIDSKTLSRRLRRLDLIKTNELFELSVRINPSVETYHKIVRLIVEELYC